MSESNTWVVGSYVTGNPQAARFLTTLPAAAAAATTSKLDNDGDMTTPTTSMELVAASLFPAQKSDPEKKTNESQVVQLPAYCSSPGVFVVCVDMPAYLAGIRGSLGKRLRRVLYTMVVAGEFITATAGAIDGTLASGLAAKSAHKSVELANDTAIYMAETIKLARQEADQSSLTTDAIANTIHAIPDVVAMTAAGIGSLVKQAARQGMEMAIELSEYIMVSVDQAQVAAKTLLIGRQVESKQSTEIDQKRTKQTLHGPSSSSNVMKPYGRQDATVCSSPLSGGRTAGLWKAGGTEPVAKAKEMVMGERSRRFAGPSRMTVHEWVQREVKPTVEQIKNK